MKRLIALVLLLALALSFAACAKKNETAETVPDTSDPSPTQEVTEVEPTTEIGIPEDFSFSLVYGVAGDMTYDSKTGELIKQRTATNVEEFTTTFFFTDEQKSQLYDLIVAMDPASYPDEYNPFDENIMSDPSNEIVLTVTYHGVTKTITCHDIPIGAPAKDEQAERLLKVVAAITTMIYASDEWQALPEYEHFYA